MRSRVWGLQFSVLVLMALLPAVSWLVFRWQDQLTLSIQSFFYFYRPEILWGGGFYALFSLVWICLMRRGIFEARFAPYALIAIQVFYELILAVSARNFSRISGSMLLLLIGIAFYRWLEKQVSSATLNPHIHWYEGNPKTLPHVQAKVAVQETNFDAKILRMDREGAFLWVENCAALLKDSTRFPVKHLELLSFSLEFRGRKVEAMGLVKSLFRSKDSPNQANLGIGLQFLPKDLYHLNEYTALVEKSRAEGL